MAKTWTELTSETIRLRKPEPEDLEFLYSIENNSDFWFVSNTKSPFSKWQLKQHIEHTVYDIYTNKELRLIIEDKKTKKTFGLVDLFEFDPFHKRVGIGIMINENDRKQGLASECINTIIDYCFNILEINQIWCNIDAENLVSVKLFEKAGFTVSGVLKQWKVQNSEYKDVLFYQLLND
ncbi:MAG: GNAT family protein [Bacteroidales bacterium]|nr:GNAT family protein [Bacteroidales bacterium]